MTAQVACSTFAEIGDFTAACATCGCDLTADEASAFLDDASDLLYQLSGGVFMGQCSATVRPVRVCSCGLYGWSGGTWWNYGGVGPLCQWCLQCSEVDMIQLRQPLISVDQVKIDGVALSASDYVVTPRGKLYRTAIGDRPPRWPSHQKLWRPDSEEDTFSVTLTFGQAPPYPAWVRNACVELGCDLANFARNGKTKLPAGTTNATMQNVTVQLQTRAEAIKEARTYLPAVAEFIAITNRAGSQSWVYSPERSGPWAFPLS